MDVFFGFMFSGFFQFIGGMIVLSLIPQFIGALINRILLHREIMKRGYPSQEMERFMKMGPWSFNNEET